MPLLQGSSKESFKHNLNAEMKAGKPMKQSLAIAYAVKRRNKKSSGGMASYAKGGEVNEKLHPSYEPSSIVKAMRAKKMSEGGMVEDDPHLPEGHNMDDFLSDEEDSEAINLTYPDPDDMESTEGMGPEEEAMQKRKGMLSKIMSKMR